MDEESSLTAQEGQLLEDAVISICDAGFEAACKFNSELKSLGEDDVVDHVQSQLEGGMFVDGFSSDIDFEGSFKVLDNLCSKVPDDLVSTAFTGTGQYGPRMRRVLVQLAIAQALHEGDGSWGRAASVYLSLLSLPGAFSYQLFHPMLYSLIVSKIEAAGEEGDVQKIVFKLVTLLKLDAARGRIVETGSYLVKETVTALVRSAVSFEDRKPVLEALHVLTERTSTTSSAKEEVVIKETSPMQVDTDNEDDEDYVETHKKKTKKKKKKPKRASMKKQPVSNIAAAHILNNLVDILKVEKQGSMLNWVLEILEDMTSHQTSDSEIVLRVLEHLCFKVPKLADGRLIIVENVGRVLSRTTTLKYDTLYRFCQFLSKLSQSKDDSQRMFAAQIAGIIASCEEKMDDDLFLGLNELVLARAQDCNTLVRTSAIKSLGLMIESPYIENYLDQYDFVKTGLEVFRGRIADAKPTVRRSAIKSMQQFLCSELLGKVKRQNEEMVNIARKDFAALCERSRDTSPLIRNLVLQTAQKYIDSELHDSSTSEAWIRTVLPLVYDSAQSVQKAAREAIRATIVNKLISWSRTENKKSTTGTSLNDFDNVWELIATLHEPDAVCIRKGFFEGIVVDKHSPNDVGLVVKALALATQSQRECVSHGGAWLLLDILLRPMERVQEIEKLQLKCKKALEVAFVVEKWDEMFGTEAEEEVDDKASVKLKPRVLNLLTYLSDQILAAEATRIAAQLLHLVLNLSLNTDELKLSLQLLVELCKAKAPTDAECLAMIKNWGSMLHEKCQSIVEKLYETAASQETEQQQYLRAIFLVGELSILGLDPDDKSSALLPLPNNIATLTMGILAAEEQHLSQDQDIRAYALVATGKFCLRDEGIAKNTIRMFVRELDQCSQSQIIRCNVIVILGDLCRRYTNMIDPHLGTISACLGDPSPRVRRHALILLTGLLQEDYIKWRKLLFVRYLMCAVDPDMSVRNLARYALKEIFPEKNPAVFHGYFVETLFTLNGVTTSKYTTGKHFSGPASTELAKERERYATRILGPNGTEHRYALYMLLIDQMSATHRLEVTNKICRDILGEILDGEIQVANAKMEQVLRDSFAILCSPNIMVKVKAGEDTGDPDDSSLQAKMSQANNKILSKLEAKNLTDHIIPLVVSFYRMLQRTRSPLLRCVCKYLQTLMKDYKEEMEQVLGADKLLTQEIEYDLKKIRKLEEEEKKKQTEEESDFNEVSTAKKKKKTPRTTGKENRRVSGVTFQQPKTTGRRSSTGVLYTPIPTTQSTKKRRESIHEEAIKELQQKSAPKLCFSDKTKKNESTPSVTIKARIGCSTGRWKSTKRKWSLEPTIHNVLSKQLLVEAVDDNIAVQKNLSREFLELEETTA